MGSSSVVVESILMIAAIVAASVFASSFVVKLAEFKDSFNSVVRSYSDKVKTDIMIVYATYLNSTESFVVYARNIGKTSIFIKSMSVYFGNTTELDLYTYDYDGEPALGEWDYTIANAPDNGLWEPGETLIIYIYNVTTLTPPYIVKLVLPNGYVAQETFAPLP